MLPGENYKPLSPSCVLNNTSILSQTLVLSNCSVSMLLTTTEAAVMENPNDKNKLPSRMPAMDDMGY